MRIVRLTDRQYAKLEEVLIDHCDCGPEGEGWKSTLLVEVQDAVDEAETVVDTPQ